ncbi:MAG: single-stranded-DNA-specific exonuclease RecJ [Candidatus Moranbacteria bacterium]|nr:single-stranded-DNA-specific exonuclease RecJ [Candidatus Moranbacteria bacterium]MBP6033958.1 single-stranded-DNA-specific exonuclease RecJ [Candidatus Moranbacteria bacterium]MBP7695583.1 single-stranded-DNA-specific exonuclease RecJ [Candidatus Moranbacteria bacterium]
MALWKYRIRERRPLAGAGHPVIKLLLDARGYADENDRERFFAPHYGRDLHDPFLFSQMDRAIDRIGAALKEGETIGIFGDYDADGVTSSVVMREALEALGCRVVVYIPKKDTEGHGLNERALDFFVEQGVRLMMTLDCGMMNHAEIDRANELGLEVIIVDHHHVPETLPAAVAIINPKLRGETYPFHDLCGAGTAFKVAQALFRRFAPEREEELKWLLDVVATGTVADVMPLVGENRVLVKYGLIVLSRTRRVGFQEMFQVGKMGIDEEKQPTARDIGFQIAPRINAASRMAHAMLAHELLMERDAVKARVLALELEAHNVARQKISTAATDQVKKLAQEQYQDKKFIFAVGKEYPFGIVGLIAGRVASTYRKPTCVLYRGETESMGSFRSIPEFSVIEAIEQCADLLVKFGGHAQAAGMTIKNEHLDAFYERFNTLVEKALQDTVTEPELWIDLSLDPADIVPELVTDIARFAPFGEGNPEPVFHLADMLVKQARFVGAGNKHLKLALASADGSKVFDAIGFSLGERFPDIVPGDRFDAVFNLEENTWNGRTSIQLKLIDLCKKGA